MILLPPGTLVDCYGKHVNQRDATNKHFYGLTLAEIAFHESGETTGAVTGTKVWWLWNNHVGPIFCNIIHLQNVHPPSGVEFDFQKFCARIYP